GAAGAKWRDLFCRRFSKKRSIGYAAIRAASLGMTGKTAVPARPSQKFPAIWEPSDADGIRLSGDSSQNLRHPLPVAGRGIGCQQPPVIPTEAPQAPSGGTFFVGASAKRGPSATPPFGRLRSG